MLKNLNKFRGLVHSQRVLLALTQAGVSREDAYRLVQRNAMRVWEQGADFLEELLADEDVRAALSEDEIREKFDLGYHTKHVDTIFRRVFGEVPTEIACARCGGGVRGRIGFPWPTAASLVPARYRHDDNELLVCPGSKIANVGDWPKHPPHRRSSGLSASGREPERAWGACLGRAAIKVDRTCSQLTGCLSRCRNCPDHRAPGIGFLRARLGVPRTHLDPVKPAARRIARAGPGAVPGIGADMVVIAAGRQEHRLRAIFRHRVEAELVMPPFFGLFGIADAQMHMADDGVFRRALPAGVAGRHLGDARQGYRA